MRRPLGWETVAGGNGAIAFNVGLGRQWRFVGDAGNASWIRQNGAGESFASLCVYLDGLWRGRTVSSAQADLTSQHDSHL